MFAVQLEFSSNSNENHLQRGGPHGMQIWDELPDLGPIIALEVHDSAHAPVALGCAGDPERLAENQINQLGLQHCMSIKRRNLRALP